ncbi:MAG: toll/interleukin-1 receptor domain-containing protein [Candidatus Kapaibacterium sp.]
MENNKVFVSHASKDIHVVEAFVEHILKIGLEIPPDRIFCSSLEGHGVKSGEYIPDRLKEEIQQSSVAILFISKNYKASEVCLNEMGAAWVALEKSSVIPLLLPDTDFEEIGFLNVNRLGIKIDEARNIDKLADDLKEKFQPPLEFSVERLNKQIRTFLQQIESPKRANTGGNLSSVYDEERKEAHRCFEQILKPFDRVLRRSLPTLKDGVYAIKNKDERTRVLRELSKTDFLDRIWYRDSEGDFYIKEMCQLSSGNWLINGYELDVVNMWISMSIALQFEFILIKAGAQEPYRIGSDIGGKEFEVGILPNGITVSSNEYTNRHAIINGETIDLSAQGADFRIRLREPHWIFLVSDYHKIGHNYSEAKKFCKKIDDREVEITEENLIEFFSLLPSHPTVDTWI